MRLKIITELLFILPIALGCYYGLYLYAAIMSLSVISALAYHLNKEKKYFTVDVIISLILISTNLYFLYQGEFKSPFFQLAMISLIASFYFWFRAQKTNYDFNHSMWHIASIMITLCCMGAYVY